jgi:formylglycine-generating enzyme required for sulfatase activity
MLQSITSVSPNNGGFSGGTAITITGTFLSGATIVKVGGVPATNVVAVDSTTVTAVTPAGSVGAASVEVTGAKGTATATNAFLYIAIVVPTWATLLEATPDPAVVTDANLRAAIVASGFAWRIKDTSSNIEMMLVPAGIFTMGCSASVFYSCAPEESPTHQVTLTQAFYMGRYEVTQAQWTAKMGSNPSYFSGDSDSPSRPVEQVSWNMIASGSSSFMSLTGLRLPTEAEWEYAYRARTTTAFHSYAAQPTGFNDDTLLENIAWFYPVAGGQTHAVGGKLANGLGLHDMSGNVWEWCQDGYGFYSSASVTNPTGSASTSLRLLRGGGWYGSSGFLSNYCRASERGGDKPDHILNFRGFRVVRTP